MLTGFNTNIRHRGVLFHVQSEDSGRDHPHVITHLFHGGNIMASEKSGYRDKVDDRDLEDVVRGIMEAQHKAVLKRLRAGDFDEAIRARLGDEAFDGAEPSCELESGATVPPASLGEPSETVPPASLGEPSETVPPVATGEQSETLAPAAMADRSETVPPVVQGSKTDTTTRSTPPGDSASPAPPSARAEPGTPAAPDAGRPFGGGIVSDKPLDEVILNYLVENARKRKRQQAT